MTSPDATAQNVVDDLDSFYCHNIVASLWADAVATSSSPPYQAFLDTVRRLITRMGFGQLLELRR